MLHLATMHTASLPTHCRLCHTPSEKAYENTQFFECQMCKGLVRFPEFLLSREKEKARYDLHQNNPEDPGYRSFLTPIISLISEWQIPGDKGLDYGCGPGPVSLELLSQKNIDCVGYDPFFCAHEEVLNSCYDFVLCTETIEHFYHPDKEFQLLHRLLKPNGFLYLMTFFYDKNTLDFGKWYYKNDPTHVFIYQSQTLDYITQEFGFERVYHEGRIAVLQKK